MAMNITLRAIVNAQVALKELGSFKPKGKFGYDVGKLIRLCTVELEEYGKAQQNTVEAHGNFDEKTGAYVFLAQAAQRAYKKDTEELLDKPVVLEVSALPFEELEKLNPTADLWAQLDWAIVAPKEIP